MKDIQEIKTAVNKFRQDAVWLKLRKRWENDFDLIRLKPYEAGEGYYSYTSNEPRNLINKAQAMLSDAKVSIRVPEETLTKEELETANNIERFDYGAININNDLNMKIDMPSIQDQMSWYATARGAVVTRPYVRKMKDGSTFPEIRVWDIYNVAFAMGKKGVQWAAYTRTASKEEIKSEYGIDIDKKEGTITDFWDEENNGVIVENEWGKKLEKHGLDYCPVFIIRAGAQPPISQNSYTYSNIHVGESILASIRDIMPMLNKTMSDYLTITRRGVKPPMGIWSSGGQKGFDEDIWQVQDGKLLQFDLDDKIAPLIEPTMPENARDMVNFIMGEIQRGGISHVAQGELGFRLSGFAINQLQAALATVIVPFAKCLEQAFTVTLLSLQEQYAKGSWKPVEVRGRTSRNQPFGVPKAMKIKPKDIKADWRPEVMLTPIYPKDDAQRYQLARLAVEGDRPLLSVKTAREELIGVEDTLLEGERLAAEWAGRLPIIQLWEAFKAALADGDAEKARNIVAELERLMGAMGGQGGGGGGQGFNPGGLGMASMGMPGSGVPSGQTGLSSDVFPPEMAGGLPAGATTEEAET